MKIVLFISLLLSAFILLNINSALASTSYYRWQDAHGNWHFSDHSPTNASSDAMLSKVIGQTVNTSKPTTTLDNHVTKKVKNRTSNKQHKNIETKQKRKKKSKQMQLCQTLHEKLNTIHTKLRAGYQEPKGNQLREQRRKVNNKIYRQC
jgi:hypothetical protein